MDPESEADYLDSERPIDERVADLMGRMTLEEKLGQIDYANGGQAGLVEGEACEPETLPADLRRALSGGAGNMFYPIRRREPAEVPAANCNAVQEFVRRETRLGIPVLVHTETLEGVMIDDCTAPPAPIALGSSWNPERIREVYEMIAREARSRGIHMAYAPVLDVTAEPRWGRVQETYGEDPYLVSELAVACVRAYQGEGPVIGEDHVAACAKHFAGYGASAGGRNFAPCHLTERRLMQRHYPPFRRAIEEAGMLGVMAGHHEIDGVPCHANKHLLTEVLREKWNFPGLVVSDANDVYRLMAFHRIVQGEEEAAALAFEAGVDLDITNANSYHLLDGLVEEGQVSEAQIDRTVERILYVKFKLGLFEDPFADPDRAGEIASCPQHQAASKRAAGESLVLLKNEANVLPLAERAGKRIALIGPTADQVTIGSYEPPYVARSSVRDALAERCQRGGMELLYAEGCRITKQSREDFGSDEAWEESHFSPVLVSDEENADALREAEETARDADVVVLCVGDTNSTCREAAYGGDHRGDRDSLELPGSQTKLLAACARTGTPLVLVLTCGRPMTFGSQLEKLDALCCAWYLGQHTGTVVVDVLFGDLNPSGKLPMTFPRNVGQLPLFHSQVRSATFRNYLFSTNEPQFRFGFGLSYTTFEYGDPQVENAQIGPDETTTVRMDITNRGERAGAEVVQLYVHDDFASTTRPEIALKGFRKVFLDAGETQQVRFEVGPEQLGYYNSDRDFVVEPGSFRIYVGPCSDRELPEDRTVPLEVR